MRLGAAVALTTLSGALYGLAFPPVGWWPLAWVALAPFLIAVGRSSARRAIGLGVLLGIVVSCSVGTWMPDAVINYYEQPFVVGVLVFLACGLLQASWQYAGFALLHRRLASLGAGFAPLLVAAAWTTAELARVKPVVGNPWALLGYSQTRAPLLVQTADLAGAYGVGFMVALANAALAGWWEARRGAGTGLVVAALVVAAAVGYGALAERGLDEGESPRRVAVAAAQANLDLGTQWKPEFYGANLSAYADLTLEAAARRPSRVVIWPESALTFFIESEPAYRAYIANVLGRAGAELLTGGPRALAGTDGGPPRYRNGAFVVSRAGTIEATYEKGVLVPFAEYFPVPQLDFLRRQFGKVREFTPGTLQAPLPTVAGPAGVMICNESMRGEHAIDRVRRGAEWLVTLANDSWVGRRQYAEIALEMARLRAVEVRRWLVRSSTSGPSAVVDPAGRIVDRLDFDRRGVVAGEIVPRRGLTIYARVGDAFAWGCAVVAIVLAILARRRDFSVAGRARDGV
jgi:apolipoprotein N-acyltransferase